MSRTFKLLLATVALLGASVLVPAAASAAPAPGGGAAADVAAKGGSEPVATNLFTVNPKGKAVSSSMTPMTATNNLVSTFSCSYGYVPPGYSISFQCVIFSGAIQIYLQCTNPLIAGFSPVMTAPGTYNLTATCGPPAVWANFHAVDA